MFFKCDKLNPSNENYGSTTTIITNLISLANTPTPVLIMYHLELNLTVSCFRRWSTDLTERKLLMQCVIRGGRKFTTKKHKKPSLHITGLTGESAPYNWHTSAIKRHSSVIQAPSVADSGITRVVFLKNYDLFFVHLVTDIK